MTSLYALVDGTCTNYLQIGKNVIGRSAVPVEGVSFINIESPRVAISRMQAFIEIAPNGDAWLSDCNSTNGTFISVRPGTGVRLEPSHYYQLADGCTVVFGDVEKKFVSVDSAAAGAKRGSEASMMKARETGTRASPQKEVPPAVAGRKRDVPYLDEECATFSAKKRARAETMAKPPLICVSGMTSVQKASVRKALRRHKGRMVDNVLKATALVVPIPASRTPKFIIAVASGIPVVSEAFLDEEVADDSTAGKHIVSLDDEGVKYSSSLLRKTTAQDHSSPVLSGLQFDLTGVPAKMRESAEEIITACGGKLARKMSNGVIALNEKSVTRLYDGLLRGKLPQLG